MFNTQTQVCDWPHKVLQMRPECRKSEDVGHNDEYTFYKQRTLRMLQHIGGAGRPNIKNHLQKTFKPAAVNTHQIDLKDARTQIDVQSEEIQAKIANFIRNIVTHQVKSQETESRDPSQSEVIGSNFLSQKFELKTDEFGQQQNSNGLVRSVQGLHENHKQYQEETREYKPRLFWKKNNHTSDNCQDKRDCREKISSKRNRGRKLLVQELRRIRKQRQKLKYFKNKSNVAGSTQFSNASAASSILLNNFRSLGKHPDVASDTNINFKILNRSNLMNGNQLQNNFPVENFQV